MAAAVLALLAPASASAAFGFSSFSVAAKKQGGGAATQAGEHPYTFEADVGLNTAGGESDGGLRDLRLALPPGFLINPRVASECSATSFHIHRSSPFEPGTNESGESCPNSSQVGVIAVNKGGTTRHFGLFNLVPPFGATASVGASPFGVPLVFNVHLHEPDNLELALEGLLQPFDLQSVEMTVWGTPWLTSHDAQRGNCLKEADGGTWASSPAEQTAAKCLVFENAPALEPKSYLTLPTTPCGGTPLAYSLSATSWLGASATAGATTPAIVACKTALTIAKVQLTTDRAAVRTGMVFNLSVNDGGGILNPGGIARPAVKTAVASLPEGLTINPSLGAGLGTCAEAQFATESAGSEPGAGCPNASKIGDVTVEEALGLAEPLKGSLFIATPYDNPFHSLLAVYMLARNARRGMIVKSVGKLEPDPTTGRLVATFDELPRLLYEHFTLTLREGQRSTLVSPPLCGPYPSGVEMASWAEPTVFNPEAVAFFINHGEGGGPCPSGVQPFHPGLLAGSINPQARASTPFYLRMTRTDGEQEITSYSATFPPGLLAKIAGVSDCPDAAIAAAKARTGPHGGQEELEHSSCPATSEIGRTLAGYGVGGVLAYAPGALYLAGPYHGAPLSVVAIDSATIGPFDLGVVVVRAAIRIDPRTAQASIDAAGSDPIPHILRGFPLHLRDIRVYVDRPDFTLNPTSCDPMSVASTLTGAGADLFSGADDSSATSTQRFQVLNCSALGFKPRLALRLGAARHGQFPSLRATYTPRAGDANLRAISVALPPAVFLEQAHIDTVCTRAQFAAGNCPAGSVYGHARATTPLMDEPLEGPVYLRSSSNPVPDLAVALRGRGIAIDLDGRVDSSRGGLRGTFEGLPDAPVTKFTMTLDGGKRGLLVNAEGLCAKPQRARARFIAQSSETEVLRPRLRARCAKPHGRHGHKHRRGGS